MTSVEESNTRHAEYRARERRNNITMMAKRMMVLQIGHHGGTWSAGRNNNELRELYRRKAQENLIAAEAFYDELTAFDTDPTDPITSKGGA